jgi:hypothetical protein
MSHLKKIKTGENFSQCILFNPIDSSYYVMKSTVTLLAKHFPFFLLCLFFGRRGVYFFYLQYIFIWPRHITSSQCHLQLEATPGGSTAADLLSKKTVDLLRKAQVNIILNHPNI